VSPAAPAAPAGDETTEETAPDPQAAACAAETEKLQAGMKRVHRATTNVVLAIKNSACGLRVLTNGPGALTGDELHRIGSVTKTYVAAVVMQLARDGALTVDDPVSKWVSGIPNGDAITLRHLLRHTSGLFNYTDAPDFLSTRLGSHEPVTPRELVDAAIAHAPYFEPGSGWHYSNTNYVLLGMVAEKAAGAPIASLVRTRVLEPIDARATFFDGEEPLGGKLAVGLDKQGKDITDIGHPSWAWAAGAIVATPSDVVTWIERLGNGSYYQDSATQREVLDGVETTTRGISYGLGIMLFSNAITGGAGVACGHGGDIPGFHTQAFHFRDKETTIVSIVDSESDDPNELTTVALDTLFSNANP
jgi:D-alanyl-D-alanine carboxypeptidase